MFNFFKKKEEDNNEKKDFFNLKDVVSKTSESLVKSVMNFVSGVEKIDEFTLDEIETMLIKADLGLDFAVEIVEKLKSKNLNSTELKPFLKREFEEILNNAGDTKLNYNYDKLNIYLVVGINGAGKTTLIGKLANKFRLEGKRVLIAAGDTFRAAAEEQLDVWAQRAQVDIVRRDGADPGAVVYEGIKKAQNEGYNVLLVDSAGRLQNKFNLIEELKKIKSVIDKNASDSISETILVLDANLGQNGLSQAEVFTKAVDVSSIAMTKLDGSAKGGMILSVAYKMKLPTKLIGVGEKITDIRDFNSTEFIEALFD